MHTVKPIDKNQIKESIMQAKLIVTVEEHNIIGGLGSAVSEVMSEINHNSKKISLGIKDTYGKCGNYEFMLEKHGLSVNKIVEEIQKAIN